MQIENNENREICARCKERCCESMGCEIFPDDVINRFGKITVPVIKRIIRSKVVMIDVYFRDDDDDIYLLRMRTVRDHFVVGQGYYDRCICLGENGCMLSWDDRPTGAKIVVPNPDDPGHGCTLLMDVDGKKTFADMWRPYQNVLKEVADLYDITNFCELKPYDPNEPFDPDEPEESTLSGEEILSATLDIKEQTEF